jgi:anti-sigma regulatory factor (Ser/Thr protein kinase)
MRELALHILDLVQNSIAAKASLIRISILESVADNILRIEVGDNGAGIESQRLSRVTDPFYTSRAGRKTGLGLSLFQAAAERTGGGLRVESSPGQGTTVQATFRLDHIDRAPLGRLADVTAVLMICNPEVEFRVEWLRGTEKIALDTCELQRRFSRPDPIDVGTNLRLYRYLAGIFGEEPGLTG